ncbi:hypothetical protein M9194_10440 [Vibrio sp. S4M6]|uniref:hypothetical protein n=1 Tax=Vibrio sinus TaxID=2946865 RepID=UPI00202A16D2|nr:hypothetical protein [Vibrio sinus]MCL9781845.1 hypothetical protein [Vibrio sinus]
MIKKIVLFFVVLLVIFAVASFFIMHGNKKSNLSNQPSNQQEISKTSQTHKVNDNDSIYTQKAKQICNMMDQSYALLENGKVKEAKSIASSAYWDVYDGVIEIKYRSYASPAQIYDVEQKFHTLANLIEPPVSKQEEQKIKSKMDDVCNEVIREANLLNKELNNN